ncbi:HdrB C-terminal domain-containing protein [Helicobacter sp. 23-1045]
MNLIYHYYDNLSLISSAIALFKRLDIEAVDSEKFEFYGGNYLLNEKRFFVANAYNIALSKGRDLLILEDDAFKNITFSKNRIDENPNLYSAVEGELARFKLQYSQDTKISHLANLLGESCDKIRANLKSDLSDFSVAVLGSDSAFCANLEKILNALKIKINFIETSDIFSLPNRDLAHKYGAKYFENALDSASDFIIAQSMSVFEMFDKERKSLTRIANRNLGDMPVLFLPQLLLLAFGERNESALNFRYHKFAPDFL